MISKILMTLLVIDSVVLVAAILLQAGKGGGLAASFGGVSWWCGGIFLGLAFILSMTTSRRSAPRSILDQTFTPPASPTAPSTTQPTPNVLPITPAPDAKAPAPPTKTP
jgi:preprotein translocase subunit SecG